MKHLLLFTTSLLYIISVDAQINRNQACRISCVAPAEPAFTKETNNDQNKNGQHPAVASQPYAKFSSALNPFGFIINENNCLSYNPDLNCVALFQRHTADWPDAVFPSTPGPGKSGYEVVKFSTNNGAAWDSVNYFQNDTYWGRYPSGVVYNPPGNTSLGNAWFVGTGPCSNNTSTWPANFFASVQVPTGVGSRTITNNDQQISLTNSAGSFSDNTYFSAYSTCLGGPVSSRTVYTGGIKLFDTPVSTAQNGVYGVSIFKGTYNGASGFNWTEDSSFINKYVVANGNAYVSAPKIAFGPDGMTGYILTNGADSTATLPAAKQFYQPMVWKTTDGGANWTRVNQNYDWIYNHPDILSNLRPTAAGNATLPAFFDSYGGGCSVDASGVLHYVTALSPGYSSHRDSLGYRLTYSFSYQQYICTEHPWVYDFTTNGNGNWNAARVGYLYTSPLSSSAAADTNASFNPWMNGAGYIAYNNRIRISRSQDGTKIFYTWADADTAGNVMPYYSGSTFLFNAYGPMVYPELHYRGLDVTTGLYTYEHVNSPDTGAYWFYYTPDIVMPVPGGYHIPATYIDSRNGTYSANSPVDVYYIDDNILLQSEYTWPADIFCCTCDLIKEEKGLITNLSVYPNPAATAASLKLDAKETCDVKVIILDQLGREVSTTAAHVKSGTNRIELDLSTMGNGIYFYSVVSGGTASGGKLVVIR